MATEIANQFAAARARAAAGIKQGQDGITLSRALSDEVDGIVRALAGPLIDKCRAPVAILATGGFGRRELAPFSDLDLLCLCADEPGAEIRQLAEALLPPLWDAKVDAGHAVRSYQQALSLPATDLAAATALLDARFLSGDEALAERFLAEYRARVAATAAEDFVARLARGAPGAARPVRGHDLSSGTRPQERSGRNAGSVRGALGGGGAIRDVGAAGVCRIWVS